MLELILSLEMAVPAAKRQHPITAAREEASRHLQLDRLVANPRICFFFIEPNAKKSQNTQLAFWSLRVLSIEFFFLHIICSLHGGGDASYNLATVSLATLSLVTLTSNTVTNSAAIIH